MMKTASALLIKTALAATVVLSAAAPAAARTPLERYLQSRGYQLPNVISYDDLYETAYDEGIVDIEKMLAEHEVPVVGAGDSRYVRTTDLLRICGKECSYHKGWGIFLSGFAVLRHRR
ncbi:MAG: hypothetical protein ACR2QC_10745 [Gammaproteobacteria bacterium]